MAHGGQQERLCPPEQAAIPCVLPLSLLLSCRCPSSGALAEDRPRPARLQSSPPASSSSATASRTPSALSCGSSTTFSSPSPSRGRTRAGRTGPSSGRSSRTRSSRARSSEAIDGSAAGRSGRSTGETSQCKSSSCVLFLPLDPPSPLLDDLAEPNLTLIAPHRRLCRSSPHAYRTG